MPQAVTETHDIQALVKAGFSSLTEAAFLLCQVKDAAAAKAVLADLPVTSVADLHARQGRVIQVATSAEGLSALGMTPTMMAGFAPEFAAGLAGDPARSRRLGDVGASAPETWAWGYPAAPHVLVMLYAAPGDLGALRNTVETPAFRAAFDVAVLDSSDMAGREPFGFMDGVSQPALDWQGARTPGGADDLDYGNLISAGEFLLGYANEYGHVTPRPLVDAAQDPRELLPSAPDAPGQKDLGRNGSYLVFRRLRQDVRGFWRFAAREAGQAGAKALAEAMVGRRTTGEPLAPAETGAIPGVGPAADDLRLNRFTFSGDPDGLACPFGAHIRRANPRTADMPGGRQGAIGVALRMLGWGDSQPSDDIIAASRFHRILRRGREYGAFTDPDAVIAGGAAAPAGLNFLCLNANLARQFEFIQNAWMMNAKFGGLTGEQDPLLGNRQPLPASQATAGFSQPTARGPAKRTEDLPQFVTVEGGGYFFLPGLAALRFIAAL